MLFCMFLYGVYDFMYVYMFVLWSGLFYLFYLIMVNGSEGLRIVVSVFMNGIFVRILVKSLGVRLVIVFISSLLVLLFLVIIWFGEVIFVLIRCLVQVMKFVKVLCLWRSLLFLYYCCFILLFLCICVMVNMMFWFSLESCVMENVGLMECLYELQLYRCRGCVLELGFLKECFQMREIGMCMLLDVMVQLWCCLYLVGLQLLSIGICLCSMSFCVVRLRLYMVFGVMNEV